MKRIRRKLFVFGKKLHLEAETFQREISDEREPKTKEFEDILNLLIDSKSHLSSRSLSVSTSPILASEGSQLEEVVILCKRRIPA